jgi:hypothetical protein
MKKTMKFNYLLSAAIVVVSLGMTGCSQSEDVADGTTAKQTITFASGEDETTTRTSMGGKYTDASFPFYWEAGDAIWVNATDKITGDNTGTAARALFTGNVTTSAPYNIRYTGTGHYETTNSRTGITVSTTSDANTLVIPPVQSIATWDEGADTKRIGANGDCGTATATGSGSSYSFKLDHKAAYLILMPRWGTGGMDNYRLKSVMVITRDNSYFLSGRFSFDNNGIGGPVSNTFGGRAIKIITGGSEGLILPNAIDQTKSINIAIKPVDKTTPLYCIYEVSRGKKTYYIEKIISGKSFPVNTITPITADIKAGYDLANTDGYLDLITNNNPYFSFFEWDVPNGEEYSVSREMCDDYNATPVTAGTTPTTTEGARTDWCTNSNFNTLPTYNQITWYLKGGCYWDADKVWGPGENQKGGMWFMKKEPLMASLGITENAFKTTQSGLLLKAPTKGAPSDPDNWFFLPAAADFFEQTVFLDYGWRGYYWSSTPDGDSDRAWILDFWPACAWVYSTYRSVGFCLWSVQ